MSTIVQFLRHEVHPAIGGTQILILEIFNMDTGEIFAFLDLNLPGTHSK